MIHLIQSIIIEAQYRSILNIPPPILSRVFQTISRGFVNLLNAKKITDTRFPFPFAQLIHFLLYASTVVAPVMFASRLNSKILAALFSFIPCFGMFSINIAAIE